MKRKLKRDKSIKGTPPITKFFKKNPDIKAKQIDAVVVIPVISPSNCLENIQHSKSKADKRVSEVEVNNKSSKNLVHSKDASSHTDLSDSQNVNDLVQIEESLVNNEYEKNGPLDSSHKRMSGNGAKKCLFNQCGTEKSSSLSESRNKDCISFEKGREEARGVETGFNNTCLDNNAVVQLKTSECENKSENEMSSVEENENDLFACKVDNTEQIVSASLKDLCEFVHSTEKKNKEESNSREEKYPEKRNSDDEKFIFSLSSNTPCAGLKKSCSNQDRLFSSININREEGTVETMDCTANKESVGGSEDYQTKNMNKNMDDENDAVHPVNDSIDNCKNHEDSRQLSEDIRKDKTIKNGVVADRDGNDNESSDEELFNPVTFLSDNRVNPNIKTPEKGTTPVTGSPLAPVIPYVAQTNKLAGRLKYSLETLLSETPVKLVQEDEALVKLQLSMKQTIEDSRNDTLDDDAENEIPDNTLLRIHKEEVEKYESSNKGFTEETHEINVFPKLKEPVKYENGCTQPFPLVQIAALDEFTKFLYERSDMEIRELLCSDWITHKYLVHSCPPLIVQWLFHILCYHIDNHTIKASFNTLWSMLKLGNNKENGRDLSWLPTVQDVIGVFNSYGADFNSLLTNVCETIDIGESLKLLAVKNETVKTEEEEPTYFPLVNVTRLIQFVTSFMDRYPECYSTKDIEDLMLLMYCISLDTRIQICQHDIKTCLQAIYSAVQPSCWIEELIKMSSVISHIETDHRNKLCIVRLQPYSSRGRDMKRLAALQTLAFLLNSETAVDVKYCIRSNADANKDKELTNKLEVLTQLEALLHEVKINDDTDYCQLYTVVELLDIIVGAENLQFREKAIVERITKKLRLVHSYIEDPRAVYINRTKVKNLILRTVTKFVYMTQGKKGVKPQKSITKFFAEGNSDLHIETLKDDEILEEDEDEPESQESQTSSFILDPLSQTNEHSDHEAVLPSQEFPL